tara:strand:- start:350 stop:745 length:396 start_codon:yes stop_codon:yes gene_type:complete
MKKDDPDLHLVSLVHQRAEKQDSEKPPFALLPTEALELVACALDHGAIKYEPHNWALGTDWSKYLSASLRHIFAWNAGEDKDPDSGLPHLSHAVCCLLFLLTYEVYDIGTDDRLKLRTPSDEQPTPDNLQT